MSVAMMPGRTSKTGMPSPPAARQRGVTAIARPALLTQYSPRFSDAISADTEVTKTMRRAEGGVVTAPCDHLARERLRQEVRTLQVGAQQLLEAALAGVEEVGPYSRRAAGVVDEGVKGADALLHLRDEALTIRLAREVCLHVVHGPARSRSPSRVGSTSASGRTPPSTRSQPSPASARAIPSPMPRVPPVTSAVLLSHGPAPAWLVSARLPPSGRRT